MQKATFKKMQISAKKILKKLKFCLKIAEKMQILSNDCRKNANSVKKSKKKCEFHQSIVGEVWSSRVAAEKNVNFKGHS